jgi:hypothetical protein
MEAPIALTLLDLVELASRFAESDREVVALVTHLVNSERVVLCGNFKGQKFSCA